MVVNTTDDFESIRLKLCRPAWKVLVNPRLSEWVGDGNDNGRVFARRVFGLIVLGFELEALVPYRQDRFLPRFGQTVSGYRNYRYVSN